jgi:hypothetical protein
MQSAKMHSIVGEKVSSAGAQDPLLLSVALVCSSVRSGERRSVSY